MKTIKPMKRENQAPVLYVKSIAISIRNISAMKRIFQANDNLVVKRRARGTKTVRDKKAPSEFVDKKNDVARCIARADASRYEVAIEWAALRDDSRRNIPVVASIMVCIAIRAPKTEIIWKKWRTCTLSRAITVPSQNTTKALKMFST